MNCGILIFGNSVKLCSCYASWCCDLYLFYVYFVHFRKRKLTHHWRSCIRPIVWRCKYLELQFKKLRAQAQKYTTKLAELNQKKHVQLENIELGGLGTKSFPFSCDWPRGRVLRRKKRRRVEETTDGASYMSNHNLFSFYGIQFFFILLGICFINTLCLVCY